MLKQLPKENKGKQTLIMAVAALFVVAGGIVTGWLMVSRTTASSEGGTPTVANLSDKRGETEVGINDESTFTDSAEGVLTKGGIQGEGTHYLDRNAGAEKYVYLTSTVIDLESFVGKKVKVWGETIAARNAPWLMDVGKLKVVE